MAENEDRQRLSSSETKQRLIDAGCELVLDFGLESGMRAISLAEAIERADVPRTSAYRVFSTGDADPQDTFRVEVLLEAVRRTEVDSAMVPAVFAQLASSQYANTPRGQAAEMRELIRRWSLASLESNRENLQLRAVEAITQVTAMSQHPDPAVLDAVREAHHNSHEIFQPLYELVVQRYGLRFRPGMDVAQLTSVLRAVAGMAVSEWVLQPGTREFLRPTGPDGGEQSWTMTGMLVESLALLALEPDPDAEGISADLSTWIA